MNDEFSVSLRWGDWLIVALYLVGILGLSVWSKLSKKQDTEEYLIARKSMNWVIVSLAVFATLFSTVSFVSVPGEAYNQGLMLMFFGFAPILFLPLAIWLFLRFFFMAPTFTAYEYLEKRFSRANRVLAALFFVILRLSYLGCVFYATSIIFQSLVGWPPLWTILAVGAMTVLYGYLGGVRAVILADVVQSIIIFCAITVILFFLLRLTHFDIGAVLAFAHKNNHTFETFADPNFYRINVHDRWCFWVMALGLVVGPLTSLSCDQMVVQRLLAGKNYRSAVRSVYTNYLISIPVITMLYGIGLILYYYYNAGGAVLPHGVKGDQVLGYFINSTLPSPLSGLVVAGLLSALMSTVAGGVNSIVTVLLKDIVTMLQPKIVGTNKEMTWCHILTVLVGFFAIFVALIMTILGERVKTTVIEVIGVWGALWGVLLCVFLYGVTSVRVSERAIFVSTCISGCVALVFPYIVYYGLPEGERWGYAWVGLPPLFVALLLPPLLSYLWPNKKNLDGLTIHTTGNFLKANR